MRKIFNLLFLMVFLNQTPVFAAYEKLDAVAAIVDSDVITESQLKEKIAFVSDNIKAAGQAMPPAEVIRQEVLDKLILESLQIQLARKAGVDISEDRLSEAMVNIANNNNLSLSDFRARLQQQGINYEEMRNQVKKDMIIQQVQQGFLRSNIQISEKELENYLKSAEGKEITTTKYMVSHTLLPLPENISKSEEEKAAVFLESIRKDVMSGKIAFKDLVKGKTVNGKTFSGDNLGWKSLDELPSLFAETAKNMSEKEISKPVRSGAGLHLVELTDMRGGTNLVYQVNARHILIKLSEVRDDEQAKAFIDELQERIQSGEDFTLLAKEYSEDNGSALQGGDLGWTSPSKFVPEFTKALETLKDNEISQPVRTDYGWHIIQKLGERNHDMTAEKQRNLAYRAIYEKKFKDELDAWLVKIKDDAFIEIK